MQNHRDEKDRLRDGSIITILGGVANGLLAAGKIGLGVFTGYLPMIASGFHSLSDIISDVITGLTLYLGSKGADMKFHFGYRRVETLISLFAAFFLVFVSIELVTHSLGEHDHALGLGKTELVADEHTGNEEYSLGEEAHHEEETSEKIGALSLLFWICLAATTSIIVKEFLFRRTRQLGVKLSSPILIAKAWHHRADSASSVVVLLSVNISHFFPEIAYVDETTTFIISGMILHSAWEVGISAVKELIDSAPSIKVIALVEELAETVEGVTFTHSIRIRTMGGALYVEMTAETDPKQTVAYAHEVSGKIRKQVMSEVPNIVDFMITMNPTGEYLKQFMSSDE